MASTTGLRHLARQRRWRRWTLASFLARLPGTMVLLALVLAGQEATGSLAVGAQLAGVATFTAGVAAPWRGRQLDRGELRAGLQRACLVTAAAFGGQALALVLGAPLWVLFALAAAQGVVFAAITGGFRALLSVVVAPEDLARANVLEAVFVEVAFVSGPAIAGVLALALGAGAVLGAMACSLAACAHVARGLPRLQPIGEVVDGSLWRAPGVKPVYGLGLALGVCIGLFEAALPARAETLGLPAASAGPLLALMAVGSGVGGLVSSGRQVGLGGSVAEIRPRAYLLLAAFGALILPLAGIGSVPVVGLALFAAGMPIAPLNALGTLRLQAILPRSRRAQGFAVHIAAVLVGAGLGHSATGQLLDLVGPQALLVVSAGVPLLAAAVVASGQADCVDCVNAAVTQSTQSGASPTAPVGGDSDGNPTPGSPDRAE